jgi:hypothetical protein
MWWFTGGGITAAARLLRGKRRGRNETRQKYKLLHGQRILQVEFAQTLPYFDVSF